MVALGKVALVALPVLLLVLGGGKKGPSFKDAYEAGYAAGKTDKENGLAAKTFVEAKTDGEKAYVKGYADGYAAGVVKGGGAVKPKTVADVIDGKPPTVSVSDIELAASLGATDGYQKGKADAMSAKASTPYAYSYSKGMPSNTTLREAYQIAYRSNYAEGYEDGQKLVATMGGSGPGFAPVSQYYEARRPNGYPRNWYNY